MFSDPFNLSVNAVNVSLARIVQGNLSASYRSASGLLLFDTLHQLKRAQGEARVNTNMHLEVRKPKEETPTDFHSTHIRLILDRPESLSSTLGFTETEILHHLAALCGFASTPGNVTKLLNLES